MRSAGCSRVCWARFNATRLRRWGTLLAEPRLILRLRLTSDRPPSPLMPSLVLLLSGGLDSYTAGALLKRGGFDLYALSVRYGQRHVREVESAAAVARALGVARHLEVDVGLSQFGG